jgi:hypothetical protein
MPDVTNTPDTKYIMRLIKTPCMINVVFLLGKRTPTKCTLSTRENNYVKIPNLIKKRFLSSIWENIEVTVEISVFTYLKLFCNQLQWLKNLLLLK